MSNITNAQWANAISTRIADEWSGKEDFSDDAEILKSVLYEMLRRSPKFCKKLIGTGIIEEDYFSNIME